MQKYLDRMGGLSHSQRGLLALTQAGVSREDAYRLVQRNAMKVWDSDGALSLMELLKADTDVTAALSPQEIEARFDLDYHLKPVVPIFARVSGDQAERSQGFTVLPRTRQSRLPSRSTMSPHSPFARNHLYS